MRRLLLLLAIPSLLEAQATARRRIRVEDSPCAPATAWRVRDTNYTTLAAADRAARTPVQCPVVPPPVDTTPKPPVDTTPKPPVVVPPAGGFLESFTGQPTAPQPFTSSALWDVQRYVRDRAKWFTPTPMDALHGMDCGAPPATHVMASYDGMAFTCRDHVMTAVNEDSYGVVVLAPARLLDFTAQAETLSLNLSTFRHSRRDWILLTFSSFADHLVLPATPEAPGLNGPPRHGVYIEMTADGNLCPRFVRDYIVTNLACSDWPTLEQRLTPSMTVRSPLTVALSRTHVTVTWAGITFADVDLPAPLPFTQAVVQVGHYSYNPSKDCQWTGVNGQCSASTWHWDEVRLSRAVPFTMIHGDVRTVSANGGGITFSAPAPAGAFLRFSAYGMWPDVSFDGGRTWQAATLQGFARVSDPEAQFWMPVPAGTQRVQFKAGRAIAWWQEPSSWLVRDVSIWAR